MHIPDLRIKASDGAIVGLFPDCCIYTIMVTL